MECKEVSQQQRARVLGELRTLLYYIFLFFSFIYFYFSFLRRLALAWDFDSFTGSETVIVQKF